jgi:tetratricopeptide (TPR) repeat protein
MSSSLRIFVSATSRDLAACRDAVKQALLKADIHPIIQEDFPHDYRSVAEMLEGRIRSVDAVICLVGYAFGAAPSSGEVRRSYTQMEYDIARKLSKPTFLFVTAEMWNRDYGDTEADQLRQAAHRREILEGSHLYRYFATPEELRLSIAELTPQLHEIKRGQTKPLQGIGLPLVPLVFVGRNPELGQLSQALQRPTPCVVVIVGLGGQGKTALLTQWVRSNQDANTFTAAFWCTVSGGVTFELFVEEALTYLLGEDHPHQRVLDTPARVRRLVACLQEQRVLLVIDQVERWLSGWSQTGRDWDGGPADRRAASTEFEDLLVQATAVSSGSHLVLTTRALPASLDNADVALIPVHEPGGPLELDGLDDDAAIELLQRLGVRGAPVALRDMARQYANHPLALTVVAGQLVRRFGGRLERLVGNQALDPRQRLFALFEETRRHLPGGVETERLLQAISCCLEDPPLPVVAVAVAALMAAEQSVLPRILDRIKPRQEPGAEFLESLRETAWMLSDWHVAEWDGETERFRLHTLLKQFFLRRVSNPPIIHRAISNWYAERPIPAHPASIEDVRPRVLAIEHALLAGEAGLAADLLFGPISSEYSLVQWLVSNGHLSRDLIGRLIEKSTGRCRADLLSARGAIARVLGDLAAASTDLSEALQLLEADPQSDPLSLAGAMLNRGNVYRQLARYDDAAAAYDRAISILDGPPSRGLVLAHLNRSGVSQDRGRFQAALRDGAAAVALSTALGDPLLIADAHTALANVLADSGALEESLRAYDRALAAYAAPEAGVRAESAARVAEIKIARATAVTEMARPYEALQDLDSAIATLRLLAAQNRPELTPTVAMGLLARAKAQAAAQRWSQAICDAEGSVALYKRLVDAGRIDLHGYLAHALLFAGYTRAVGDSPEAALPALRQGLDLAITTIRAGQLDMRIPLVRVGTLAGRALLPTRADEAAAFLNAVLADTETAIVSGEASEGLTFELTSALERLDEVWTLLRASGLDWSRITRLRAFIPPR